MKLGTKITLMAVGAVVLASVAGLLVQRSVIRHQGVELTRGAMKSMLIEAESVRDSISSLNQDNAFATEKLVEELATKDDYRDTVLYQTIPVVASWNAVAAAAEAEGYRFRVIRNNPRNPDNAPDPYESTILRELEAGSTEFFEINEEHGVIAYARPVHIAADCLACHGDPANSLSGDGKDLLGFRMENREVGDMHGAFLLTSDLEKVNAVVRASFLRTLVFMVPLIILVSIAAFLIVRKGVVQPLNRVIATITRATDRTRSACGEISTASNSLAEGASEQAASIEQTSASLEELSGQTAQNAENANQASDRADRTREAAESGSQSMENMVAAMTDIEQGSDAISSIVRSIDEIAFQTNLLALNAAVEAARAGEAGAGFSVVADEVRSLALRSAEAAKETARLVEASVGKSRNGRVICDKVSQSLQDILIEAQQVNQIVREVASSAHEQNAGIDQINQAVGQMDRVIQNNAATTEETAAVASELENQANHLSSAVEELLAISEGRKPSPSTPPASAQPPRRPENPESTTNWRDTGNVVLR